MNLFALLNQYLSERDCSTHYRDSLRRTVRKARVYGIENTCQILPDAVNQWLRGLEVGPTTRANIRREFLTLWRYAYEEGLTNEPPRRVTRYSPAMSPPEAYSSDDLARMMECAEQDATPVGGTTNARVCDVIPPWVGLAYDTGLRFTDVLEMRKGQVRRGCVCVTARKTGKASTKAVSDDTASLLRRLAMLSPDDTLWLWCFTRRRAFRTWRAFLDRHVFRGSSRWLRRSCATYSEQQEAGAATRILDHSAPHLARQHYIDVTLLKPPAPPPPIKRRRLTGQEGW